MDLVSRTIVTALFFWLAWYLYHDVSDIPLAQLTLKQLGSNIPSLILACLGFAALTNSNG